MSSEKEREEGAAAPGEVAAAVAYVRGLSLEAKSVVYCELLKELIALNGGGKGLIPVRTADGEDLGYHVAPLAAAAIAEVRGPKFTEERWAELEERFRNPGPSVPIEQVIEELKAEAAALQRQRSQSPEPAVA